jgi:vesicle coat complex subunit
MIQVLQLATTKSSNPDLRDRAYMYWRLLSSDPEKVCMPSDLKLFVYETLSSYMYWRLLSSDPEKVRLQTLSCSCMRPSAASV